MRNQFAETFYEMAKKDLRLMMLVADISPAGSMSDFREKFPHRFINTGVAEQIMIGMAAGMAMRGLRPFAYSIATFSLFRCFEFVRVDLAYQNLPVTVVGVGAGVSYSILGSTHHAMEDIAVASAVPNLSIIAPCDPLETKLATQWCAIENNTGPVYLRLGKAGEPTYTKEAEEPFIVGKLRYICRGKDTCILTYGPAGMRLALELKEKKLKHESVSVVSCHTIKPLDLQGIEQVFKNHRRVVVIEEHVPHGGLGSRVKEFAWDNKIDRELYCYSLQDEFIHFFGGHDELLAKHGLAVEYML